MADQFSDLALSADEEALLHDESAPPPKEEKPDEAAPSAGQNAVSPGPEEHLSGPDGNLPAAQPRTPEGKFAGKEARAEGEEDRKAAGLLAELREERKARQELERRLAETSGVVQERIRQLQERVTKPPEPVPTVESEPIKVLEQVQAQVRQLSQQQEEQHRVAAFAAQVKQQIATYRQQDADYLDKLSFAREARSAELKALGVPEDRIPGQLEMDEANLAMVALQNGRNPGQAAAEYAIAKGWKPKAAPEKPKDAAPQQTALEKLATIDAGQKASRSLGGGGAPDPELTLEKVLEMTPEQIGALPEDKWRAVMGA